MSTVHHKLLIAHANRAQREQLAAQFDLDGYEVHEAPTSSTFIAIAQRVSPAAIIIGTLERPAAAGAVLRELREGHVDHLDANVPAITLGETTTSLSCARTRPAPTTTAQWMSLTSSCEPSSAR